MTGQTIERFLHGFDDPGGHARPPVHLWTPGEVRDIGLRIAVDGGWWHDGAPITRRRLVRLFASILRREDDGEHYLVTPHEKVRVVVEDAPFLAVEMVVEGEGGGDQCLGFRTNVGDRLVCDRDHPLEFSRDERGDGPKPYVLVRYGLRAKLVRAIYYDLVELAVFERISGIEQFGVWSSGRFFTMLAGEALNDIR